MNSDIISLQYQLQELREKQQKTQEQLKMAFDQFNDVVQQLQVLQLPKQNLKVKVNVNEIKQKQNTKILKQIKVYKEKNLFKRFVSQIVFRNIMQFLSTQDIKQLRLVSVFTNYLIETNIEYLLYYKIQRTKYIESLNIRNFQEPKIPNLRNVCNSLKKLMYQRGKINKIPNQLLSYLTLIIDLNTLVKSQNNKRNEFLSKYDILQIVTNQIQNYPLNWYGFIEKDKRMIKNISSIKFTKNNLIDSKEYDNLKEYIKNLFEFSTSSNYKEICDAHNKDQILIKIQKQTKCLNQLLLKMKAKQNYINKISDLGNLFFKSILSYCQLQDIMNSRFVCQKFNQEFQQNANFHFQIQAFRIQKQINLIQTNFNLSQSQDEFLQVNKDQHSLMELFYCIQKQNKLQNNINMKDFLQINSQNISDIIFKSQIENDLYLRSREQVRECLGIDILVESNYNTFQMKLEKSKECLINYYIKLPQLQKKLINLENHYQEPQI
ncbi:unnamed protein product [Paramecium primaurelia]|uniref:F-box protein n=1 Tax=Paramecium primaurelia TaxID=5886 RepID=A0A8S1NI43_PARPR|nr:unnamed protein product [Paramecium primaurelia]